MTTSFDLLVIGGGPGGYVAAIRAAQSGLNVACIERDRLGGICLNWGCIPTKSLLRNAEIMHLLKRAPEFGFSFDNLQVDLTKVVRRSRDVSDRLSKGVAFLFKKNKVQSIEGTARLVAPNRVVVTDRNGNETGTYEAPHIILATGGRPRTIPGIDFDGKRVISSTEAMVPTALPKSLAILGAGAIGVEFAYFYNAFGTQVTIIEMLPNILPLEDPEHSEILAKNFAKAGMKIKVSTKVKSLAVTDDGVRISVEGPGGEEGIEAEQALMAIGVRGNVENLGLEEVGVLHERSFVKVDDHYRTNVPGVYAIGDLIGPPLLAHVASHEGIACVDGIIGKPVHPVDYDHVPGCTYCHPQVASIGLSEPKAKEVHGEILVGRFPIRALGKALAAGETEGQIKLIFDAQYKELIGAHLIGPEATELIAELGLGMSLEVTQGIIQHTMHAHPTLSEGIMEAAANAIGEAIHI